MFTGIITEIGEVQNLTRKSDIFRLGIKCGKTAEGLEAGDSVAVNGVCLTAVGSSIQGPAEKNGSIFFDIMDSTFNKTGLKRLKKGDKVNLENVLKQGDKISGHVVTGHIDGERVIKSKIKTSKGWIIDICTLTGDEKYLISSGSVAVDGISLTVGELVNGYFRVFLIPHTLENTILKLKKSGYYVNVEFDMMARYAEKQKSSGSVTEDLLKKTGFLE